MTKIPKASTVEETQIRRDAELIEYYSGVNEGEVRTLHAMRCKVAYGMTGMTKKHKDGPIKYNNRKEGYYEAIADMVSHIEAQLVLAMGLSEERNNLSQTGLKMRACTDSMYLIEVWDRRTK